MDYEKLHKETLSKLQERVQKGLMTEEDARGICSDFVMESDDDRIRKEIIQFLRLPHPQFVGKRNYEEWIAYLEKQKQNPLVKMMEDKKAITKDIRNGIPTKTIKKERNVKFATPVDVGPAGWSDEDEKMRASIIMTLAGFMGNEEKISWLYSIRPHTKQQWSEEDEDYLMDVKSAINDFFDEGYAEELCTWLKSLSPRPNWKPSEEQMKALEDAKMRMSLDGYGLCPLLQTLINDLKTL